MSPRPRARPNPKILIALVLVSVVLTCPVQADNPPQPVKSPLSPEESLTAFRLAPDLKIEIVAAEPEVVSPVSIAFDEEGRLWVVEMSDYPNGPTPGELPKSRIKLLEDRDADGRFETAHIFADKLLFATGVQPWRGGVIVTLAGEIAYFKDTDGDHKADVRETWFRGFVQENPQLRANHPRFALDNHIYVANGLRGGTIVADKEKWGREIPPVSISGKDFRFDPLTGNCEAVSGNGQYGLTFDDFGNRFVCSNRNPCRHVVLEDRYLKRNPFLAVKDVCQDVSPPAEKSRIFPISRAWTTSNLHAGQFTAACGVLIYRGDALPKRDYYGNSFVCEPTGNLVHRDILEADGPTFNSHYAQEEVEFLASPDEWFRPVDLANGPDGALYVVDMYRAVVEHPEWVPAELKNRPDLYDGSDRGRIYRIVAKEKRIEPARRGELKMGALPTGELAKVVEHSNAWHRDTAARLLFERQDKSVVRILERSTRVPTTSSAVRVLSLSLIEGLGGARHLLDDALDDSDRRLRDFAIKLLEPRLRRSPEFGEQLAADDSTNSFQLAPSLGQVQSPTEFTDAVSRRLAETLVKHVGDDWIRAAVFSSAGQRPGVLYESILGTDSFENQVTEPALRVALRELFEIIGARNETAELNEVLAGLAVNLLPRAERERNRSAAVLSLAEITGLGRGIARRGGSLSRIVEEGTVNQFSEVKVRFRLALDDAALLARDVGVPVELRLEAISAMQFAPFDFVFPSLLKMAQGDPVQEIRLRAIDVLATFDDPMVGDPLLTGFWTETPAVRRSLLRTMLRNPSRTKVLLLFVEKRLIAISELDPASVQALTNHKDEAIREQARKLLAAAIPAERKLVLEKYQPALALKADARQGRTIFERNCVTCHKIGDLGVNVAPDISDSRTKTPAQLLNDILNPNQAIDNNYVSYSVLTKDGKTETGIVSTETASSITLRQPEGKTVLILRQEIDELKSNGISLMPEGLEKNITVEQMADLISFIKNWRYLDGAVPLAQPH